MIRAVVCEKGHPIWICPKSCAQVDTHAERRDVKQARPARVGSAVPSGMRPNTPPNHPRST
jgi:hypothetical protein